MFITIPSLILYTVGGVFAAPYVFRFKRMFDRDLDLSDMRQQEKCLDQGNSLMARVKGKIESGEYQLTLDQLSQLSQDGIFPESSRKQIKSKS